MYSTLLQLRTQYIYIYISSLHLPFIYKFTDKNKTQITREREREREKRELLSVFVCSTAAAAWRFLLLLLLSSTYPEAASASFPLISAVRFSRFRWIINTIPPTLPLSLSPMRLCWSESKWRSCSLSSHRSHLIIFRYYEFLSCVS